MSRTRIHPELPPAAAPAAWPVEVPAAERGAGAEGPPTAATLRLMRMMHYLEWLAGRFNRAGVPLMALKGAALHLTVYRRPQERAMADLDVLVRPADLDRALGVLEEAGCLRRHTPLREDYFPRYYYEVEYTAGALDPIEIDLHVRPFRLLRYARLVPDDGLWARARPLRFGTAEIFVPCAEEMLLHLAVHSAIHGNREHKWLLDIRRWVQAHGARIDWARFLATARAWHLALPVRQALAAAGKRLGPCAPGHVRAQLAAMPAGWRDRLALWHAPRDRRHMTRAFLVELATTPGLRFKLGYLRTVLAPGGDYMDEWCTRRGTGRRWARLRRCLQPLLERLPGRSAIRVGRSPIHGQGVLARRDIAPGRVIARYRGRPIDRDGTYVSYHRNASGRQQRHEITGPLRYVNHCCQPNARLEDFRLVALRRIRAGQEITISYGDGACDCKERRIVIGGRRLEDGRRP